MRRIIIFQDAKLSALGITEPLATGVAERAKKANSVPSLPAAPRQYAYLLKMATDVPVFVGSFNVNGEPLTEEIARRWLAKSADAQIVIIGFQEYGYLPERVFPEPRGFARREEYIRGAGPSAMAMENEKQTLAALDAALECAPGQRPTSGRSGGRPGCC